MNQKLKQQIAEAKVNGELHSPAPWEIHQNVVESGDVHIAANYDREKHGYPLLVAQVVTEEEYGYDSPFDRKVTEANARLIAAAPELLKALLDLIADVDVKMRVGYMDKNVVKNAWAAVAKARGTCNEYGKQ